MLFHIIGRLQSLRFKIPPELNIREIRQIFLVIMSVFIALNKKKLAEIMVLLCFFDLLEKMRYNTLCNLFLKANT